MGNVSNTMGSILFIFFTFSCFNLSGCASSNVSRDTAASFDRGVQDTKDMVDSAGSGSITDAMQDSSQATKGAIIGGTAGAITGGLYSGIGAIPGAAAGAIFGASYGSYIDANTTLEDQLENRGVIIVVLGDQILIVLPSAKIFNDRTPNIKPQAFSTLALVTRYVNRFTKMIVTVAAYTDDKGSRRINMSLSKLQAESVAKFLLESGVDARLLYAVGYDGAYLREINCASTNSSENYRVEITLEKLHV